MRIREHELWSSFFIIFNLVKFNIYAASLASYGWGLRLPRSCNFKTISYANSFVEKGEYLLAILFVGTREDRPGPSQHILLAVNVPVPYVVQFLRQPHCQNQFLSKLITSTSYSCSWSHYSGRRFFVSRKLCGPRSRKGSSHQRTLQRVRLNHSERPVLRLAVKNKSSLVYMQRWRVADWPII